MNAAGIRERLAGLLSERDEVHLAYLFGSQVEGHTGPLSDVDVAVLVEHGAARPALRDELAGALRERCDGAPVDLMLLNEAPVELAYSVIAQGTLLYECAPAQRVEYEAYVMGRYGDYLPVLRSFRDDILHSSQDDSRVQRYRTALRRTLRTLGSPSADA